MPRASRSFIVNAPSLAVSSLLQDLQFLSSAVPGVVQVERLDDRTANWTVRLKVGFLERTSVYRGELLSVTPESTHFRALGPEATVEGTVTVRTVADGTQVEFALEATGTGALRAIIENVLARRLPGDVAAFEKALRDRLDAGRPARGRADAQ